MGEQDELRYKPYIWATWLAAALGDDNCEWKPWYKANHKYAKREATDEDKNRLAQWSADHDLQVRAISSQLIEEGWVNVWREDQTKFNINGNHAIVGGKADIIAFGVRPPSAQRSIRIGGDLLSGFAPEPESALVVDVKTGRPNEKDYWQVVIYMVMLPIAFPSILGHMPIHGEVRYTKPDIPDDMRVRRVTLEPSHRARLLARIREIATQSEPPHTPSARECNRCDILACTKRVTEENGETETEEF